VTDPRCPACNDPGNEDFSWLDRLMFNMHLRIDRLGWTPMYVLEEGNTPGRGYTIGLSERHEHPELVIVGLDDETVVTLLAELATRVTCGERLDERTDRLVEVDGRRLRLAPVHPGHWRTDRFNMWLNYYGALRITPPRLAMQAQWPDRAGRYPGDPGFDRRLRRTQPRLYRPPLRQRRDRAA
jgi:Domain of unknown function (DUF4262)